MGKQLVNFITCSCESSAPIVIYKAGYEPSVLVIVLYELLGNPTTELIEPPGALKSKMMMWHNVTSYMID